MRAPIGIRIASRRKALGISQADLARAAGISPSYLNLIEANKRQVGGSLLQRIAAQLALDLDELTGEAEHRLIHELVEAFADPVLAGEAMGIEAARTLVATRPDIARIIARLHRAYAAAMASADAYADRLRADPLLTQLLHQMLSGATAIRSGAEILATVPDLEAEDQQRFLATIARETLGLGATARNLIGQFEQASVGSRLASARREVDDLIFAAQNHFPELERLGHDLRAGLDAEGSFGEATMAARLARAHGVSVVRQAEAAGGRAFGFDADRRVLWFGNTVPRATRQFQMARLLVELEHRDALEAATQVPALSSDQARSGARRYLGAYVAGAALFPYDAFLADARALRYDVDALAERYTASFEQIAHRLVTLRRAGASGVPFGFLRAEPAGRLSKHFPLPGLLLPNTGHACPLWAIYAAFRLPGQLVRQVVRFSDGSRFLFVARAVSRPSAGFADPALPHAILLVTDILHADETVYADGLDLNDDRNDVPVGPGCRLCTRTDCASRQEAPWAPGGEEAPTGFLRA